MRSDRMQAMSNMTTRQKITIVIFVLVVLFLLWQIIGLFRGSPPAALPTTRPGAPVSPVAGQRVTTITSTQPQVPQPSQLMRPQQPLTPREQELIKLQQETQAKYIQAVNELQMLKVSREIAETTKDITAAKLATVTAQKNIINLLAPPAPPQVPPTAYAQGLVSGPLPPATTTGQPPRPTPPPSLTPPAEANFTVISVSQLQYKWYAVLGYQGNLYHVSVGDILQPDGSKVISIDKSGVVLQKNGAKKKISLVPII